MIRLNSLVEFVAADVLGYINMQKYLKNVKGSQSIKHQCTFGTVLKVSPCSTVCSTASLKVTADHKLSACSATMMSIAHAKPEEACICQHGFWSILSSLKILCGKEN